jgi:CRISPR-associated protein Csm1
MPTFDVREYQTVIIAALLHDIGKMLQRGSFGELDTKGQHPAVSAVFVDAFKDLFSECVDFDLLKLLVQRHHENPAAFEPNLLCQNAPSGYRNLCFLVSRADNYSSSERGEKAEKFQDYKETPLASVLGRIRIDKASPDIMRYRLGPFTPEKVFPEAFSVYEKGEVNRHLAQFGQAFQVLRSAVASKKFDVLFSHIATLLLQFAWNIPSNTQEVIPDVSLYDHLKTTAAIAACLYQYHAPDIKESDIKDDVKEKFCLLSGDLSGIQNYIFSISHVGIGGAAKRLRARSLYLSLLSDMASHRILHAFNLPLTNILMASGGKFYVLLPSTPSVTPIINSIQREIDEWLYKEYNGEISMNLALVTFSGNDFEHFDRISDEVGNRLLRAKKTSFRSILTREDGWDEDRFLIPIDFGEEEKLCKVCGKFQGERDLEDNCFICARCSNDKALGRLLPNAQLISFYQGDTGKFTGFPGYSFDIGKPKGTPYLVMSLDGYINPEFNYPYAVSYKANYIPIVNETDSSCETCKKSLCEEKNALRPGQPLLFQCIANRSMGQPMLGFLKADVDNLGAVFAIGLKGEDGSSNATVSRVSTLSRLLDAFFSGFVTDLIRRKFKDVYTVYSGGDDLLLIGPWNIIIDLAAELNSDFTRFGCHNANLTFSAGIALVKQNHPVFRSVEMADTFLEHSKRNQTGGLEKASATIFGDTLHWERLKDLLERAADLARWLEQGAVSAGFVHNLLDYAEMYRKFKITGKTAYLKFLPLLTYDIARNLDGGREDKREARAWAENLKDLSNPQLDHLGVVVNHALMARRGGKDE